MVPAKQERYLGHSDALHETVRNGAMRGQRSIKSCGRNLKPVPCLVARDNRISRWARENQPQENSLSTPQKRPVFRHPKSKVFIANRAIKAPLSLGVLIAPPFPLGLCGPPGRRLGRPPPPRGGYRPISGRARPPAPPASTAPQPGPGIDSGALKPGKAGMLFKTPLLLGDPKRDPA